MTIDLDCIALCAKQTNSNMRRTHITMLFAIAAVLGTASCDNQGATPEPGPEDGTSIVPGTSAVVSCEDNSTTTIVIEPASDWTVELPDTAWFEVSPASGPAGTAELTVTTLAANPEITEKVSSFIVNETSARTKHYVIQEGTPCLLLENSGNAVSKAGGETSFTFIGNMNVDVVSETEWITVTSLEADSTLLEDNTTWSRCRTFTVTLNIEANDGEVREGTISVKSTDGQISESFTVSQMGSFSADFSKTFLRRSLFVRYTGTWCGNCPIMNQALHNARDQYPEHIVQMNLYQNSQDLTYPDLDPYFEHFGISYLPTAIVNYYAMVANHTLDNSTERFVSLAKEATDMLPSNTMLGGCASLSGDEITVEVSIASKNAGDYYLSAFILEDGIIREQEGHSGDYEHSNIMRAAMTERFGDPCSLNSNSVESITLSMPLPTNIANPDNLHIVVFTSYDGRFTGDLADGYIVYRNYDYIVDNAVDIPVGGIAVFDYEN